MEPTGKLKLTPAAVYSTSLVLHTCDDVIARQPAQEVGAPGATKFKLYIIKVFLLCLWPTGFSPFGLRPGEVGLHQFKPQGATDIVTRIDYLLTYVDGINDERDSVPLLIEVRKAWPEVKAEIERLRARK